MFNLKKFEAKSEEEAVQKCIKNENMKLEEFIYKVEKIEGKLFKSSKYKIYVLPKSEIVIFLEQFFEELSEKMNISITTKIEIDKDNFNINIVSNNNSILIGKDGKTLNALQVIIRQIFRSQIGLSAKINLDISNYRMDKLKKIDKEMENIIGEVIQTNIDVYLDPMNAYERRYVHNLVNSYDYVKTESVGEGLERRIIIKYDAKKKI